MLDAFANSYQIHNPSVATLYEDALVYEQGSAITSSGALSAYSGKKTGRSPQDKRIVKEPSSENDVWWGPVNKPMSPDVSILCLCPFYPCQCSVIPPSLAIICYWSRGHREPSPTAEIMCLHKLNPQFTTSYQTRISKVLAYISVPKNYHIQDRFVERRGALGC